MCKKSLLFVAFLFFLELIFFSCSSETPIDLNSGSGETLRMTFSGRNSSVIWSREIENSVLSRKINASAYISSNLKLGPEIYIVSAADEPPVYPSLSGFGSLDSTQISPEAKSTVENFVKNIISWNFDENLVSKNSVFSLILFKYDIENGWKNGFGEEFPSDSEKKLFSSYYFGEPFVEEDSLLVPVRLKNSKGFVDIQLFIDKTENFRITQILIKKWGK